MNYPIEDLDRVRPARADSLLVVREMVEAYSAGGIILTGNYTTGVKKPLAWVVASSSPDYKRGDAVLLSPGVSTSMIFGEGSKEVEVFACEVAMLMGRFDRMPEGSGFEEDLERGHTPLPPHVFAIRQDRRADEGIPL